MNEIKIGRFEVSASLLMLFAWLLYQDTSGLFLQGIIACGLHETAHCVLLYMIGNRVKFFRITLFGARLIPETPMTYCQELAVAAAGPAVNLILALWTCRMDGAASFAGVNLALAIFNLLPIGQMDGGRMVRCVLGLLVSDRLSDILQCCLSFSFTAFFLLAGISVAFQYRNLSLFLMCIWILAGDRHKKTVQF